jgi:hypothetical protein
MIFHAIKLGMYWETPKPTNWKPYLKVETENLAISVKKERILNLPIFIPNVLNLPLQVPKRKTWRNWKSGCNQLLKNMIKRFSTVCKWPKYMTLILFRSLSSFRII